MKKAPGCQSNSDRRSWCGSGPAAHKKRDRLESYAESEPDLGGVIVRFPSNADRHSRNRDTFFGRAVDLPVADEWFYGSVSPVGFSLDDERCPQTVTAV